MRFVQHIGDTDIGYSTDAADHDEQQQTTPKSRAAQPLVAIGDGIIQFEVEDHCDDRRDGLFDLEPQPGRLAQAGEDEQMYQHPDRPDQTERNEAQRQQSAANFIEQQPAELNHHQQVQLALARNTFAKGRRNFLDPKRCRGGQDQIEEDLKPLPVQPVRQFLEQWTRQHEKAAHGIGQLNRQEDLR